MPAVKDERESKRYGMAGTLAIHVILLLLLILWKLIAPVPPPEDEGIMINFGTSDQGTGNIQPTETTTSESQEEASDAEDAQPDVTSSEPSDPKAVRTQETEPAPSLPKKQPKKETKPKEVKKPVEQPKKPEEPKPDPKALYTGSKSPGKGNTGNEGQTGDPGDQGSVTGDPNAGSHSGSGLGNSGISFNLAGRSMLRKPTLDDKSQETGKVVVEIIVDKNGNVVGLGAAPARGSTTSAQVLIEKAKSAARLAKFSPSPTGVEQQKGTITFIFKFE